jgi:hypothetical protein
MIRKMNVFGKGSSSKPSTCWCWKSAAGEEWQLVLPLLAEPLIGCFAFLLTKDLA